MKHVPTSAEVARQNEISAKRAALRAEYAALPVPVRVAFQATFTAVDRALDDSDYEVAAALISAVSLPDEGLGGLSLSELQAKRAAFIAAIQQMHE